MAADGKPTGRGRSYQAMPVYGYCLFLREPTSLLTLRASQTGQQAGQAGVRAHLRCGRLRIPVPGTIVHEGIIRFPHDPSPSMEDLLIGLRSPQPALLEITEYGAFGNRFMIGRKGFPGSLFPRQWRSPRAAQKRIVRHPVLLLPPWSWPHHPHARSSIASFVLPRDPLVRELNRTAERRMIDSPSRTALLDPHFEDEQATTHRFIRALFETVSEQYDLSYRDPEISGDVVTGTYQTIRPPGEILGGGAGRQEGGGNCLDLTLLLAGCLEGYGLRPLLVFTGNRAERPHHVFLACWTRRSLTFQINIDKPDYLRGKLAAGELIAVESTQVCHGAKRGDFDAAVRDARARIEEEQLLHAVDIAALRELPRSVEPIDKALQGHAARRRRRRRILAVTGAVLLTTLISLLYLWRSVGPGLSYVRIETDPPSAVIWEGEGPVGIGNVLSRVEAGTELLYRASAPGYVDSTWSVQPIAAESTLHRIALRPRLGALHVRTDPPGANLWLDSVWIGQSPHVQDRVSLPEPHILTASVSGYESVVRRFGPMEDSVLALSIVLPIASTRVSIATSPPGALTLLDGAHCGTTPVTLEGILTGSHFLELSLPGYASVDTVLIVGGDELKLLIRLSAADE